MTCEDIVQKESWFVGRIRQIGGEDDPLVQEALVHCTDCSDQQCRAVGRKLEDMIERKM